MAFRIIQMFGGEHFVNDKSDSSFNFFAVKFLVSSYFKLYFC